MTRPDIRTETAADVAAIDQLLESAFGGRQVPELVLLLRASEGWVPELALLAELDGQVVGFVSLTTTSVRMSETSVTVLLLSPLAVASDHRGQGIARQLVEAGHARATETEYPAVLLEGEPVMYARLGYEPAEPLGLKRPSARIPEWAWQVHRLPAWSADLRGLVEYPTPFWQTGSVGP